MNRINLNKLYYFYVVAKEGSIKAASELLHLTQPTISGQIRELEADIGYDLFIRKHRKLEVSPQGLIVLKKAEEIFKLADTLTDLSQLNNQTQKMEIRIGTLQSLSISFIHDFSNRLWRDGSVRFHVTQGHLPDLTKKLNHAEIDILLADGSMPSSKKYQNIPLGHDQVVAVASPKFKLNGEKFPNCLHQQSYIAFSNEGHLQREIEYFFERQGLKPETIGYVDDLTLMRRITETSNCFATLPRRSIKKAVRDKKLKILGEIKGVESQLWAITPRVNNNRTIILKLLRNYFKNH